MNAFAALVAACAVGSAPRPDTNAVSRLERVSVQPLAWPTPEMLTDVGRSVLREERRRFADEIRDIRNWKPNNFLTTSHAIDSVPEMSEAEVASILAALERGAADTVQDNLERFRTAVAARIPLFAAALEFHRNGEYQKAADTLVPLTLEKILQIKRGYHYDTLPPLIYCTTTMLEAESFGRDGALHDAIVRYQIVFRKLRASVTFSATARLRCCRMYEQIGRPHFAMPYYRSMAEKLAEALTPVEILGLHVKVLDLRRTDPFVNGLAQIADSAGRLAGGRTGAETQASQERILAYMNDMMIKPEEDERWFGENSETLTAQQSIDGAILKVGRSAEKFLFTNDVAIVGSDDWGQLRPREKQELLQMFNETYSERYRDMLEQYYRGMSAAETRRATANGGR